MKQLCANGKTILMAAPGIFNAVDIATLIGIMRYSQLIYTLDAGTVDAAHCQQLYLEAIRD